MKKITMKQLKQPKVWGSLCILIIVFCGIGYAAMKTVSARPAFCASCHNMQTYYDTYTKGHLLAKKHAEAGVTCHDCHEPSLGQQMDEGLKFITGNYKEPLPEYEYSNEQCLKCHNFDDVKAKTAKYGKANPHDSTHAKGNQPPQCYECHSVHHLQSAKKCNTCHTVDWVLDDSWEK
ncbi:cytochrome c3 family protein [Pectinatus brassicae]|uniref:Cytochrome c-type protein n=1 Tax=Pectinatus brassicae TaxID=862415 RepID=A0A840UTL4_9FIRM|nr:cytochrome c3 family protein [Pectinatus brassicae]MBB5336303.1 nitrate/TMAO reductase-like tetraheme cytochrome c subunit [Pectinatus brassicae]